MDQISKNNRDIRFFGKGGSLEFEKIWSKKR